MRARRDEEREDEREERRKDETAAKGAHFNGSGANKCRDTTRMTRAHASVTRETRMTCAWPSATAIATPRERYRASERAPPPPQRARACERGEWNQRWRVRCAVMTRACECVTHSACYARHV